MDRCPEPSVVGLSLVVNVSIRATTQYTRAILCKQRFRNGVILHHSPICIYFNFNNVYLENATPSDKFHVNSVYKVIRSMRVTPCKILCIIKFITAP